MSERKRSALAHLDLLGPMLLVGAGGWLLEGPWLGLTAAGALWHLDNWLCRRKGGR